MYNDENRAMALAKHLNGFDYVLIDTCSLMEDAFPAWMDRLVAAQDYLEDSSTEIYVPKECIEELERHSKNKKDFDKRGPAKRALKILKDAKRRKLITILKKQKKDRKSFADNAIYVKVSTDRLSQKILVITQDKKLASDLIALNNLLSQRGRNAHIMKFEGAEGNLVPNRGEILPSEKNNHKPNGSSDKSHGLPKPISGGPVKPIPGVVKPQAPEPRKIESKAPPKEEKPVKTDTVPTSFSVKEPSKEPAKKTVSKAHSATGNSLQSAISSCASGINLMFRYPSIPYARQFHGDVDLTETDLEHIVSSLEERRSQGIARVHYSYKGLLWSAEPLDGKGGYRAWIEKISVPETAKTPDQPKDKASSEPEKSKEVMPNGVVKVIKTVAVPKEGESKASTQPGMTDEEYASVKEGILAKLSFVSARSLKKTFGLGPYRASKVIRRMQEEHLLGTEPNPQYGFPVLKQDPSPSAELKAPETEKPASDKVSSHVSSRKKASSAKSPSAKKDASPEKEKAPTVKAEPAKKPVAKPTNEKKPSPTASKSSADSKAGSPKSRSATEGASKKVSAKAPAKAKATSSAPSAKTSLKTMKEESKPSENKPQKPKVATMKAKQNAPKKAVAPSSPSTPSEPRLIVLAPTNEEERKAMTRRTTSKAKPKAESPKNESKDFALAKEKEKALQALIGNPSASKAKVSKAIDDQLLLIERLTPSEKRKLTLHKTQLLMMKKS